MPKPEHRQLGDCKLHREFGRGGIWSVGQVLMNSEEVLTVIASHLAISFSYRQLPSTIIIAATIRTPRCDGVPTCYRR